MFSQLQQLEFETAGRFKILTTVTEMGVEIMCLDHNLKLVVCRRLSLLQLQNQTLRSAIVNDLRGILVRPATPPALTLIDSGSTKLKAHQLRY